MLHTKERFARTNSSEASSRDELSARRNAGRSLRSAAHSERTLTLLRQAEETTDPARRKALHEQVVLDHLAVARSLANRYRGRGIDLDDLTQVAYLGLVKAVAGCHPDRCDEFLQYAVPTIVGEIKRYFRDRGWAVRPTRRIQELHAAVVAAQAELQQSLGREPSEAEVMALVGADGPAVREAAQASQYLRVASLDALAETGVDVDQMCAGDKGRQDWVEDCVMIRPLVAKLNDREKQLVGMRFVDERTQAEIGKELGLSQMHISRLLKDVLTKLRNAVEPDIGLAG